MAAAYIEKYRATLEKVLYEPGTLNNLLAAIEKKTGVKRIYVGIGKFILCSNEIVFRYLNGWLPVGAIGIIAIYLVFGYGAQLLCNSIGFAYPAYASVKAIETNKKDDDTKWLTYWVVYAYLCTLEFFSDIFLSWFPLYWLVKVISVHANIYV